MRTNTVSFFKKMALMTGLVLFTACQEKITPDILLDRSLAAHGGMEQWEAISTIEYSKRTVLYDSVGTIESDITKRHSYSFKPTTTLEMKWVTDSTRITVQHTDAKTEVFYNEVLAEDTAAQEGYEKEILGAYYVYWMPYRLLEKNAKLQFLGLRDYKPLGTVYVLEVNYPDSDNKWRYYFDAETCQLVGNSVYHTPTYSFIENTRYETESGLNLNAQRSSYRVDSVGAKLYKRADYWYQIISIHPEL